MNSARPNAASLPANFTIHSVFLWCCRCNEGASATGILAVEGLDQLLPQKGAGSGAGLLHYCIPEVEILENKIPESLLIL